MRTTNYYMESDSSSHLDTCSFTKTSETRFEFSILLSSSSGRGGGRRAAPWPPPISAFLLNIEGLPATTSRYPQSHGHRLSTPVRAAPPGCHSGLVSASRVLILSRMIVVRRPAQVLDMSLGAGAGMRGSQVSLQSREAAHLALLGRLPHLLPSPP